MKRLKELRIRKNLTQQQIANLVCVGRQAYAKWETGEREPDNATLLKLADFFQVTTDYLLERPNAMITHPVVEDMDPIEKIRVGIEESLQRPISKKQAESILIAFDQLSKPE